MHVQIMRIKTHMWMSVRNYYTPGRTVNNDNPAFDRKLEP